MVSGKTSTPTAGSQTRTTGDGSVCAAVASRARASVDAPAAAPTTTPTSDAASQPQPAAAMSPADLATMMAAAIESALKPMKNKMEATIIPMQRTIRSLPAEFVAMREDTAAGDDAMLDARDGSDKASQRHRSCADARHVTEDERLGLVKLAGAAIRGEVRVGDDSLLPAEYLRGITVSNMFLLSATA